MASLIKNQILKHLSKFTKNLSPDKVQLSALKGEAELKNLVLDEAVLTDVLELPSWIQLSKAICNRVSVKIQWTKLKSTPIVLNLDEVVVDMETCDVFRNVSSNSNRPSYSSGSTYGFSDKVVDGMTVNVNSVTVNFKSHAFYASAQLTRIRLESRTPAWKRAHLQMTRVKDTDRGEVLIFKELDWQLLRIEAQALKDGAIDEEATPLRLITNYSRCRITIKKKLIDCSVISSRLVLIMDDLLWVLTDSQIHQAFAFINSFSSLIKQSTELSQKVKGARKLESLPEYMAQANQLSRKAPANHLSSKSKVFSHYDVVETSYHLYSSRIDLHLCDEATSHGHKPSLPQLANGGALQIILANLSVDYYPYHLANGERKHWLRYNDSVTQRKPWVQNLMNNFHQRLVDLVSTLPQSRIHTPLHRAAPHLSEEVPANQPKQNVEPGKSNGFNNICSQWKFLIQNNLKKLMSSSFIFRIEDLTIYKISTGNSKQKPEMFLSRSDFVLPQDVSLIHVEHTLYYYPGDINLPVPAPKLFINISPLLLIVDVATILWLNSFGLGLQQAAIFKEADDGGREDYIDIKIEALMPKICFKGDSLPENQPDRPSSLNLQASRVVATNCRDASSSSRFTLAKCFDNYGYGSLFFESSEFPSVESDFLVVPDKFLQYAMGKDSFPTTIIDQNNVNEVMNPSDQTLKNLMAKLTPDLLWTENRDIWSLFLDPFWAEFITIGGSRKKPVPFVDAFPLTIWMYSEPTQQSKPVEAAASERTEKPSHKLLKEYYLDKTDESSPKSDLSGSSNKQQPVADMYSVAHISSLVSIQLNHFQFVFLMRIVDKLTNLTQCLVQDTLSIVGDLSELKSSACFSAFVPQVQISLLMPIEESQHLKNASASRNSSSIDLSLNQERVRSTTDIKSSSSESQDLGQSSSGVRSPTDMPDSMCETVSGHLRNESHNKGSMPEEGVSDVVVTVDSSFLPPAPRKMLPNDDTRSLQSYCDDVDTTSMKSDLSSDSEQYVMVDYENHPVEFALLSRSNVSSPRGEPRFEVANEIKDDADVSSSLDDDKKSACSSEKRNDLFQVLTIEISQVQVIQQSQGSDSIAKVTCNHLNIEQGNGPETWHNFQDSFSARGRVWKEPENVGRPNEKENPTFKLRLENGPNAAERFNETSVADVGHLSLISSNLDIKLRMSIITGLLDLIEDEIIPQPPVMPIRIKASNIKMHLDEDRPLVNITSPGPVPVDLSVHECYIYRDSNGIFHIEPKDSSNRDVFSTRACHSTTTEVGAESTSNVLQTQISASSVETVISASADSRSGARPHEGSARFIEELQQQNEQLTFKLISFTALEEENSRLTEQLDDLKAVVNQSQPSALENARVMMKLLESQDEVKRLEDEKKTLVATMQLLQSSLNAYEKEKKKPGSSA